MNTTLKTLLNYSKQERIGNDWNVVADALNPIYGFTPSLYQVVNIVVAAYSEVLTEPRYELGSPSIHQLTALLMSPISGFQSMASWGTPKITESFTVEQFYTCMINHMISNFRITRVDWCIEELKAA